MNNNECLICKKHYIQEGSCSLGVKNCLYFEEEPRGKMVRTKIKIFISEYATTPILKSGSIIELTDYGRVYKCRVVKILEVNMQDYSVVLEMDYHENQKPKSEKKKLFKIIK